MDMYRILENFDAVNSKHTVAEGQMKRSLENKAKQMSKAAFVADAGEYGMQPEEAAEFWNNVNGEDDKELDEERRSPEEFDDDAMAKQRARLAREKQKIMMQRKISGQDSGKPPVVKDKDIAESDMEEGNKFAHNVLKAKAAGMKKADLDGDGDMENVREDDMSESFTIQRGDKFLLGGQSWVSREEAEKQKFLLYRHKSMAQQVLNKIGKPGDKIVAIGQKSVAEAGKAPFPGTSEYELRFGKDDASSAFDKKKISTGTVYSRKHFDEPDTDDDAPRAAGRPKGTGRKLGAKGPSVASKLLKGKGGLKEHDDEIDIADRGEYDREGDMALNQVHQIADAVRELHEILAADDNLPEWVQSKITKALDYIDTARDYLDAEGEMDREELPEIAPVIGAMAGRALAGAAGAGSVGQALGGLAGRAVAGAMNSGDDEVAEASSGLGDESTDKQTMRALVKFFKDTNHYQSLIKGPQYSLNSARDRQAVADYITTALSPEYLAGDDGEMPSSEINRRYKYFTTAAQQLRKFDPAVTFNELEEASPPGEFKPGDRVLYMNKFATIIAQDGDAYGIRIDGKPGTMMVPVSQIKKPSYDEGVAEAGYSAKAGRAGKDLGKPGKNFSKIAAGSAERYGSKAAGERVAGAVLNKLRAKEGIDEQGTDEGYFSDLDVQRKDKQLKGTQAYHAKKKSEKEQRSADSKQSFNNMFGGSAAELTSKLKIRDVEEESADKKDPPFTPDSKSSFKKSTNPNRTNTDTVKALAQKGLADMTTAELKAELKRRDKAEESTDVKDQHAEKAGKKVTQDIESDDKKGKKEVEETTVSGSVTPAAGGAAPKSKNGMQFGKGVYEGQVAESFEKQLKNVLNEGMSVNVSTDDTGKKSISVNATDADADALGDMLKMAGLFSSEGPGDTCPNCNGMHNADVCPGHAMEEDLSNSPDPVYTDTDYMTQTLSGGLNGPKTTGQTTGAVVNRQDSRQGVMAEASKVTEQAESRLWNLYKQYEKK